MRKKIRLLLVAILDLEDVTVILLSGIGASAMARYRVRAFNLPNMIGNKQLASITAKVLF